MKRVSKQIKGLGVGMVMPVILYLVLVIIAPDKAGGSVVLNILQQAIIPAILGWGLLFNLKTGLWDFSVGANVLITSIIAGNLSKMLGLGNFSIIIFCILIGTIIGSITGLLFTLLKIPSIIVTVGVMLILESVSTIIFGGNGVVIRGDVLALGSFPWNVIIGFVGFVICGILYNYKKFGYHVRAVGSNAAVARFNGLNINSVRMRCIAVAGFYAGLYSILNLGGSGVIVPIPDMGTMGIVFNGIICGLIAIAIEKWVNPAIGVIVGAVAMKMVLMIILTAGVLSTFQQVVIAVLLLVFMAMKTQSDSVNRISGKLFRRNYTRENNN